jgi:hypothetical protein
MVLSYGEEHNILRAEAWVERKGKETLAICLHANVLVEIQKVYDTWQ